MKEVVMVGLGSGIGGALRYILASAVQGTVKSGFPYGTLLVNLAGCLLIGTVYGLAVRGAISPEWRLYLATGLIGGFTTFSAFSIETLNLISAGRLLQAGLYVTLSMLFGLSAAFVGLRIGQL